MFKTNPDDDPHAPPPEEAFNDIDPQDPILIDCVQNTPDMKLKLMPANPCPRPVLRPFRLEYIGPDYTIGLFGKRREGKSFAMRWIVRTARMVVHLIIRRCMPCGTYFLECKFIHRQLVCVG